MNKTKISNHQLFSLTSNGGTGGSFVIASALIARIAKQDAWITPIVTLIFGLPVLWIYWFLGSKYPNMTLVGMTKEIFGKWIGSIFVIIFIIFCFLISCVIPWLFGNFITTSAMPETPTYVINLLLIIATVISVLYGIETIARISELLIYSSSILLFISMILVSPNLRIENLQPILERGIVPLLKSSIILSCYVTFHLITLMMIYPISVSNIRKTKKPFFIGYIWAIILNFVTVTMSILVLGSEAPARFQYPAFTLAKEINIGVILTGFEFVIAGAWVGTGFIINVLFFYAVVKGISELVALRDHKKIAIPLGLIVSVMSVVVYPSVMYQINWSSLVLPPYSITTCFIFPIVLLIVYFIKKRFRNLSNIKIRSGT